MTGTNITSHFFYANWLNKIQLLLQKPKVSDVQ